jgi:hypothetical protein
VGISGTVQVASSLTNPVFVRSVNDAVQPFQQVLHFPSSSSFLVPAGKRLVIEDVSVRGRELPGARAYFTLTTTAAGTTAPHYIPTVVVSIPGLDDNIGHELVRFYADPGTLVSLEVVSSVAGGNEQMDLSGYLVNLP